MFDDKTLLTVAICTYRRHNVLEKCLEDLHAMDSRSNFEIVIVDNSLQQDVSNQFSASIATRFERVRYVITPKSGLSYARNVALSECHTPYIVYLDDDAFVRDGWADGVLDVFKSNPKAGVVGGRIIPDWEVPKPEWLEGPLLHPFELDLGEGVREIASDEWLIGASIAYSVDALRAVGGFNENLGRKEDLLLCHEEFDVNLKIKELGLSLFYTGKAVAYHMVQKERISLEWVFKNAFWERVSRCVHEQGLDARSFTREQVAWLNERCEDVLRGMKVNEDTKSILAEVRSVSEDGLDAFQQLNFISQESSTALHKVFIVTPTYNSENYLEECIQSVVSQKGDFELFYHIQDGGSTDKTLDIVRKWKKEIDENVFPYSCNGVEFTFSVDSDEGMYDAIDKGFLTLDFQDSDVLGWINSDDILLPGAIEKAAEALSLTDVSWVCGQQYVRNEDGHVIWHSEHSYPNEIVKSGLCDGTNWAHLQQEGSFWNGWLWSRVGGLNTKFLYAGDWDLWRRFANHASLYNIAAPLGAFTVRNGQLSTSVEGAYNLEIGATISEAEMRQLLDIQVANVHGLRVHKIEGENGCMKVSVSPVSVSDMPQTVNPKLKRAILSSAKLIKEIEEDVSETISTAKRTLWDICVDAPALHSLYGNMPKILQKILTQFKYSFLVRVRDVVQRWRVYRELVRSGLFFSTYYESCGADVKEAGRNPLWHYILHGSSEGRMPNPLFDDEWYRTQYPDVRRSGVNPLYHFYKWGWREGRDPCPSFSVRNYIDLNSDVAQADVCPLTHYFLWGIAEGRQLN